MAETSTAKSAGIAGTQDSDLPAAYPSGCPMPQATLELKKLAFTLPATNVKGAIYPRPSVRRRCRSEITATWPQGMIYSLEPHFGIVKVTSPVSRLIVKWRRIGKPLAVTDLSPVPTLRSRLLRARHTLYYRWASPYTSRITWTCPADMSFRIERK